MASPTSGDRPGKSTNGSINRQHETSSPRSARLDGEQTLADNEQTLADREQTLSDADHTSAERDHTSAERDHTSAERDQTSADRDQLASDRDQAASDRDLAQGVDPEQHEASRDIRRRTERQREQSATARLCNADERDASAATRDLAGLARDRVAVARDLAMAQWDAAYDRDGARAVSGAEIIMRAADQRRRATEYRAQAAAHRAQAASDREVAAADREQGARDRAQALADRKALARALALNETDPLTGSRTRAAGLMDLDHELDRCHRTRSTLVLVYIDVIGLKRLNDSEGHDAGDRLLQRVVARISEHLRSYDLVIRQGGDEFLCAMTNMTLPDAHERFSAIASALATGREAGAIRLGFAELRPDETTAELITRADGQLIDSRTR